METVADPAYCRLMARYNSWCNNAFFETISALSEEERRRDFGVYFKSIHGTLNHLLYADRAWFGRFIKEPYSVTNISQELYLDFEELRRERVVTDATIQQWADTVTTERLQESLTYRSNVDSLTRTLPLGGAVAHFFNHQTHHRGQITTLLALLGKESPLTDIAWMPEVIVTAA